MTIHEIEWLSIKLNEPNDWNFKSFGDNKFFGLSSWCLYDWELLKLKYFEVLFAFSWNRLSEMYQKSYPT